MSKQNVRKNRGWGIALINLYQTNASCDVLAAAHFKVIRETSGRGTDSDSLISSFSHLDYVGYEISHKRLGSVWGGGVLTAPRNNAVFLYNKISHVRLWTS